MLAVVSGESASSEAELARLRAEVEAARAAGAVHARARDQLAEVRAQQEALVVQLEGLRTRSSDEMQLERESQGRVRALLSEARSSAAKWAQELTMQCSAKENLLDEVNSLKGEANDLTEAHEKEVERLQVRLQELESVHDSLDVRLAQARAPLPPTERRGWSDARHVHVSRTPSAGAGLMLDSLAQEEESFESSLGARRAEFQARAQRCRYLAQLFHMSRSIVLYVSLNGFIYLAQWFHMSR